MSTVESKTRETIRRLRGGAQEIFKNLQRYRVAGDQKSDFAQSEPTGKAI